MDLTLIDQAIEGYKPLLSANVIGRLQFFRGLWAIQNEFTSKVEEVLSYPLPYNEQLLSWYWGEKPLLMMQPLVIDKDILISTLKSCSAYILREAGLNETATIVLKTFDWRKLISEIGLAQAGYDPNLWTAIATEAAIKQANPKASLHSSTINDTGVLGIVLRSALRPMLAPVTKAAMVHYTVTKEEYESNKKPLCCPVCGGRANLGFLGHTPSSGGNGRILYCTTCGSNWEFERIRCALCGTQNQNHLHYFHVEDDSAHRLCICDECQGYLRISFLAELKVPFCMEVEDVVMARLDHVANHTQARPKRSM
jgi:FdhE protein